MNIYNDSSEPIREAGGTMNGNFTNLTVQNFIAQNAAIDNLNVDQTAVLSSVEITNVANHSILTAGVNGSVNGLLPGANKEILVSNGLDALWTNSLTLQDLQTNTLKIPGTVTGDILVFDSQQQAQRLAVGASGKFMISDGTNPTWNDLPNPMILGGLQLNGNFEMTTMPNRTFVTDNTGFVVSEQPMFTSGSAVINSTPSQIYGVLAWQMTNNAWYSIKIQINNGGVGYSGGYARINLAQIGYINNPVGPNTWYCEFTYNHTGSTGLQAIALEGFATASGTTTLNYSIRVERMPTPNIV